MDSLKEILMAYSPPLTQEQIAEIVEKANAHARKNIEQAVESQLEKEVT